MYQTVISALTNSVDYVDEGARWTTVQNRTRVSEHDLLMLCYNKPDLFIAC